MPTGLKVLSAVCSKKCIWKTVSNTSPPEVCLTTGTSSKVKSPLKETSSAPQLFSFSSKGNLSNTIFAEVFVADLLHLYPMLLFIHTGASLAISFIVSQLVLSLCNWPHKGLPVICQNSLDEARIYPNFKVQWGVLILWKQLYNVFCGGSKTWMHFKSQIIELWSGKIFWFQKYFFPTCPYLTQKSKMN